MLFTVPIKKLIFNFFESLFMRKITESRQDIIHIIFDQNLEIYFFKWKGFIWTLSLLK